MQQSFPFAVLLVRYADLPTPPDPITPDRARELFTKVGRGKRYIVDWFDENTHGGVDIGESQVFGWFDLQETTAEFTQKGSRTRILLLAQQAAQLAGVDLTPFKNTIVVSNLETDSLWGSPGGVSCTAATAGKQVWELQVAPSVLCQEMIHGLGIPDLYPRCQLSAECEQRRGDCVSRDRFGRNAGMGNESAGTRPKSLAPSIRISSRSSTN